MPIYEFYKNIVFFSLKNNKKSDISVKNEEILNYRNFEIHLKKKENKKYVVMDYKKIYKFLYKFRKVIAFLDIQKFLKSIKFKIFYMLILF